MTIRLAHVLAATYIVVVAGLITLRALFHDLQFMSMGWILIFAIVPLLPWLIPRFGPALQRLTPFVQSFKVGAVQIDLRKAQPAVTGLGVAAEVLSSAPLNPAAGAFSSTQASQIIDGMQAVHEKGAGLVVVDLQDGGKWSLPNLYFLARLLEADPLVHHVVFTEARGGIDGFFVGVSSPRDLRLRVEAALPTYASAAQAIAVPRDMRAPNAANQLGQQFNSFRAQLTQAGGAVAKRGSAVDEQLDRKVTPAWIRELLGPVLGTTSIEAGRTLSEDDIRTIVASPHRYLAATAAGRFTAVIDREPIALAVARAAITQPG